MGIRIIQPGLFTTVQDEGRLGYQKFGVSPSGPMDPASFHLANILVGNARGEGALETTFTGPVMEFDEDNIIAVTGGNMQPVIGHNPVPMNQAVLVKAGERISFGPCINGARGYIAFAGGLKVKKIMASESTLVSKHLGGVEGRQLKSGDEIAFASPRTKLPHMEDRKISRMVYPTREVVLRAVCGPQDDSFSKEELRKFFWHGARITDEFDRMGCRLKRQEPLHHLKDGNIISDGIVMGSVQVPSDGQPIIMMADRQTVGGYCKIATVITQDLSKLAQALPGMYVRFVSVDIDTAQAIYVRELNKLDELEQKMRV